MESEMCVSQTLTRTKWLTGLTTALRMLRLPWQTSEPIRRWCWTLRVMLRSTPTGWFWTRWKILIYNGYIKAAIINIWVISVYQIRQCDVMKLHWIGLIPKIKPSLCKIHHYLLLIQGMEIVQTMNSDPGLAVGKVYFLFELNISH